MKTFTLIVLGILFTSALSTDLRTENQIKFEQEQVKKVDSIAVEVKKLERKIKN
jgi:hypothetical protein